MMINIIVIVAIDGFKHRDFINEVNSSKVRLINNIHVRFYSTWCSLDFGEFLWMGKGIKKQDHTSGSGKALS